MTIKVTETENTTLKMKAEDRTPVVLTLTHNGEERRVVAEGAIFAGFTAAEDGAEIQAGIMALTGKEAQHAVSTLLANVVVSTLPDMIKEMPPLAGMLAVKEVEKLANQAVVRALGMLGFDDDEIEALANKSRGE